MLLRKSPTNRFSFALLAGVLLAIVALFAFAAAADASGGYCDNWQGVYWSNPDLSGQPTLARCDQAIDFDWEGLSPDPAIPVDRFSARWTRTHYFAAGSYRFSATMDDGMRVYLDGKPIIDDWREANVRTIESDQYLSGGPHKLTVEYFEDGGNAVAGFTWYALNGQKPIPPKPPQLRPPSPPQAKPPANVDFPVAEVKASYLNVRSGPGVDFNVVAVLHRNQEVYLVARDSGGKWVQIRTEGVNGWVNRYYLHTDFPYTSLPIAGSGQPMPPHAKPPMPQYDAVVNASSLNVRMGPGVQYRPIAVVHGGTGVSVVAREGNGWVKIEVPGTVVGWVNGGYLTFN